MDNYRIIGGSILLPNELILHYRKLDLTHAEKSLLEMIIVLNNVTVKTLAGYMQVSPATIEMHIGNIREKGLIIFDKENKTFSLAPLEDKLLHIKDYLKLAGNED